MRQMLAVMAILLFGVSAQAQPAKRPVVVELFTSQGCSSCPPADAVLAELTQRDDILALGFHVTYWNNLGWRDPYSLEIATTRQRFYQWAFGTESVYTPQMVIDGRAQLVGSDRSGLKAALQQEAAWLRAQPPISVRLSRTPAGVAVDVSGGEGTASLILVGYDPVHRTEVARGENSGRALVEANIVRSYEQLGSWKGGALHLTAQRPTAERAAVILQAADGKILGAARLEDGLAEAG